MANTEITIAKRDGVLAPSEPAVRVVDGDTVSFTAADGVSAALFFSPDAAGALFPAPAGPVEIAAGADRSFSFTTSKPGAYSVFVEPDSSSAPAAFPVQASDVLKIEIDLSQTEFSAQSNSMKTG